MIYHGEHIKIVSNGMMIGSATSCTIEALADAEEKASATSARSRTLDAGRTDWKVSISKFVDNMKSDFIMAGQEYVLTMYVNNSDMLTGQAICTESQMEFSVGKLSQGNCTFIGNGDLT